MTDKHNGKWRAAKRHEMEKLPDWIEDHYLEINLDPYLRFVAPDPLVDTLQHEPDTHEVFRDLFCIHSHLYRDQNEL